MDLLLDTHVCLWWATDPKLLRPVAADLIGDPLNTVWVSAASAWELAIKVRTGKLTVDVATLVDQCTHQGFGLLGIGVDDASSAGSLDWSHRDPFDRMLAAQTRRAKFTLLTRDTELLGFLGEHATEA